MEAKLLFVPTVERLCGYHGNAAGTAVVQRVDLSNVLRGQSMTLIKKVEMVKDRIEDWPVLVSSCFLGVVLLRIEVLWVELHFIVLDEKYICIRSSEQF